MNQTRESTIRMATAADASAIAEIYNHHIDVGGATFDTDHWTKTQATAYLQSESPDIWLVADVAKQVVGWASARRYSLRQGYRLTCETAIYLAPTAIGRGLGDSLQYRIDDHCQQHRLHHAVAKIIADNERSMTFHRRHGYELVGVQKEIGRINDRWVDVAILQKIYR